MRAIFETTGRQATTMAAEVGRLSVFLGRAIRCMATSLPSREALLEAMATIGAGSALVVICVAVFVGMNITLQGYCIFRQFGGQNLVGIFVALSMVREMSPMITAVMVAAKAGTDMAAKLGTMRVRQQIDAIEVMGVNPFWLLIVPRMIASLIAVPLLVTLSNFFALLSGYVVAVYQLGVNPGLYTENVLQYVHWLDLWKGMAKGVVLGFILAVVSCYYGFHATEGAKGVGRATNRAVVVSCILATVSNYILTEWMYG
ncbi:MAG: ABC transporter permease [Planctomycetes bacterium]|nr:ABC transporter permease [Planctomycetota bacterium]